MPDRHRVGSIGLLCFICKRQQAVNIIPKCFFVTGVVAKPHIVMVTLYVYFSARGAAIAEPSAGEEPSTPPWNEGPKAFNCGLKSHEVGPEKVIDVRGPIGSIGVDGAKLGKNTGTKVGTGGRTTRLMIVAPNEMSTKSSHEHRARNGSYVRRDKI